MTLRTRAMSLALAAGLGALCLVPAYGQASGGIGGGVAMKPPITAGHCTSWFAPNIVQDAGAACGSGSSSVTSVTGQTGIVAAPTTGAVLLNTTVTPNANILTNYAVQASDGGKFVTNATNSTALTIAAANTTGFNCGTGTTCFGVDLDNFAATADTLTATTSLFDNGLVTLVINPGQDAFVVSDGANYRSVMSLPLAAAGQIIGTPVGGATNYPIPLTQAQLTAAVATFTSSLAGVVPASGGGTTNFLRADGSWAVPPGSGGGGFPITLGSTSIAASSTTTTLAGLTLTTPTINGAALSGTFSGAATFSGADIFSANGAASAPGFQWTGTSPTGTASTAFPGFYLNCAGSTGPSGFSTSGQIFGINACTGFAGNLIWASVNGLFEFDVTSAGNAVVASGGSWGFNGRGRMLSTADGVQELVNNAGTGETGLILGAATSSGAAIAVSGTALTAELGSLAAGGSFNASGSLLNTGITTDSTHTDATVCEDTTSHQFYFGSGTLGICLGTSSIGQKDDVDPLPLAIFRIMGVKPVSFFYKPTSGHDPHRQQYGFIAEWMGSSFPELVGHDASGKPNSFDMFGMFAWVVKAEQEIQWEIVLLVLWNIGLTMCVIHLMRKRLH